MLPIIKKREIVLNILKKTDELINEEHVSSEKIAFFRDEIRKNIFFLEEELREEYSEIIIKYVVFPLISYVDEKIMFKTNKNADYFKWNVLQLEYYNKDDGGEYVFEIIDNLLSDNIYPRLCYEVVFLILQCGFQGKYHEKIYDHKYVAYKKKINKIIQEEKNHSLIIHSDIPSSNQEKKKKNRYLLNVIKFIIPLTLFGISILALY